MCSVQRFVCLFFLAAVSCLLLQGCEYAKSDVGPGGADEDTSPTPKDNKDNEMGKKWEKHVDKVCENECMTDDDGDDCVKKCKATHNADMTDEEKEEWVVNVKAKCGAICEPEKSEDDDTEACPITVTPSKRSSCQECNKCIKKHDQPRLVAKQMEVQRLHKKGRTEERAQGGEESAHSYTCPANVKIFADELRRHKFDDYVCNKYIWESDTINVGFNLFMCTEERDDKVFVSKNEEKALRHAVDKAHDDIFRSPESRAKIGFAIFDDEDMSIGRLRKEVARELLRKSFDARRAELPEKSRWKPAKMDELMEYSRNFLYNLVRKGCLLDVCQELCPTSPSTDSTTQQSPAIAETDNLEDEDPEPTAPGDPEPAVVQPAVVQPAKVEPAKDEPAKVKQTSLAQRRASRSRALDAFISTGGRVRVDHRHSAHRHSHHGHSDHRHSEHRHSQHRHAMPGEPPLRHHQHHRRHPGEDFAGGIETISALLQKQAAESELGNDP